MENLNYRTISHKMTTLEFDTNTLFDNSIRKPDIPQGKPWEAWKLRPLSSEEFYKLGTAESLSYQQLGYLAAIGELAATSHNTVPGRKRLNPNGNTIEIVLDRKYVLPASDAHGRQGSVSIGCDISNIEAAARCYGLEPHLEFIPTDSQHTKPLDLRSIDQERYVTMARIHFQQGSFPPIDQKWLEAMLSRKVIRAEYDETQKLPDDLTDQMKNRIGTMYPDLTLHLITDKATLVTLGSFQFLADHTVFNIGTFSRELGEWLIPNADQESYVGMRGVEFGLDDDFSTKVHRSLKRDETLSASDRLTADEIQTFAKGGGIGINSSSAVGVITVKSDTPQNRIHAGRAYEDLSLLLHLNGFCNAIHAGITEVEIPNRGLQARLRTIQRPTVVFRIGKPKDSEDWNRPHSSRPPLSEILLP